MILRGNDISLFQEMPRLLKNSTLHRQRLLIGPRNQTPTRIFETQNVDFKKVRKVFSEEPSWQKKTCTYSRCRIKFSHSKGLKPSVS